MCGILWYDLLAGAGMADAGMAGADAGCIAELTEKALAGFQRLQHRGPDHSGHVVVGDRHFMGAHRLAISGLGEKGDQPLRLLGQTVDGEYVAGDAMVCNGQIYNCAELADLLDVEIYTDVDVVLDACGMLGSEAAVLPTIDSIARALDGDFAFVVVRDTTVYIARDPVGVRPLFYGADAAGTLVCAASEVKAIRDLPGVAECRVFPPGHVYDSASKSLRSYTDLYDISADPDGFSKSSYDAAGAELRRLLTAAVKKRIECSDRPVAFLCSGGIDSSIILSIAYDLMPHDQIHVFSIQYDNPRCPRSDDALFAGLLAAQFGVRHTAVHFAWADVAACAETVAKHIETYDPNTIRAAVPMYLLAKHIRENTDYKVILSGEGADELFMGYNTFLDAPDAAAAAAESVRLVRNIHMFDALRADRCFNAHGLELRVPFLDTAFARAALRVDGALRMSSRTSGARIEKALLRDAFSDCPRLRAARILDRGKERFSDGCGSAYVPDLLNHWSSTSSGSASEISYTLEQKTTYERAAYRLWFNEEYPGLEHLIITRENPAWCAAAAQNAAQSLLGM